MSEMNRRADIYGEERELYFDLVGATPNIMRFATVPYDEMDPNAKVPDLIVRLPTYNYNNTYRYDILFSLQDQIAEFAGTPSENVDRIFGENSMAQWKRDVSFSLQELFNDLHGLRVYFRKPLIPIKA